MKLLYRFYAFVHKGVLVLRLAAVDSEISGSKWPLIILPMDTLTRSVLKTVVWRVVATIITLLVTYAFTGEIRQATTIALVVALLLMVGYYLNERVWDHITWGRKAMHLAPTQDAKPARAKRVVR